MRQKILMVLVVTALVTLGVVGYGSSQYPLNNRYSYSFIIRKQLKVLHDCALEYQKKYGVLPADLDDLFLAGGTEGRDVLESPTTQDSFGTVARYQSGLFEYRVVDSQPVITAKLARNHFALVDMTYPPQYEKVITFRDYLHTAHFLLCLVLGIAFGLLSSVFLLTGNGVLAKVPWAVLYVLISVAVASFIMLLHSIPSGH